MVFKILTHSVDKQLLSLLVRLRITEKDRYFHLTPCFLPLLAND